MNRKKRWGMYITSLAAVVLLGACTGGNAGEEGASPDVTADAETSGGKVLNVQFDVEVASMDPQIATDGTSFEVIANIIDGLYTMDKDGNTIPALAESTDVSEDGLTYTFKLKDAKWSNGESVKADDFVYAWRRLIDPETASEYNYIMGIAGLVNAKEILNGEAEPDTLGVEAVDEKTLEVKLAHPVPYFESLMAFPSFYPMNEKFREEKGESYGTSPDTLIANGAFKITSYEPATTTIELEKKSDYYDADKIQLDGIKYQVIKDSQQAMLSYQNGDLDVVTLAGEQVDLFKDDPEFQNIQDGFVWYVSVNNKVEGLDNSKLRKAMATSINKEAIANTALKDGSKPADYIVPEGLSQGPDGKDFRETAGTFLEYDAEGAKALFEEAKEELGDEAYSFNLVVEDTESAVNVAQMIKSQVESNLEGVTLEIEQMPKKTRLDRMNKKDYELGLTRWGPDYADPMTYLDIWVTDGGNNNGSWSSEKYDELIFSSQDGELSHDKEARWEALKEAEEILLEDAGILPVYQKGSAVMMKENISGVDFHSVGLTRVYKNATKE